jgi:hypothetical protein
MWLAGLGSQKIDEVFDPSKGIDQMIDFYLKKGYTLEWIEARIKAIIDRKNLLKYGMMEVLKKVRNMQFLQMLYIKNGLV